MTILTLRDLGFVGAAAGGYDANAATYIAAVEAADGQALEAAVKDAINAFVVGCKADGIWNAIKASCILAGARTLSGALVPLAGTAPTNFNFVAGDYNRKTGLLGNGSTKYLNSNRNNNADPQDNKHISVYAQTAATSASNKFPTYIGGGSSTTGSSVIGRFQNNGFLELRNNSNSTFNTSQELGASTGFIGLSRSLAASFGYRALLASASVAQLSQAPASVSLNLYRDASAPDPTLSNARLAFYSIGEALDLALLDARVTALINAFAAAIP